MQDRLSLHARIRGNRDPYAVGDDVVVTSFTGPAGGAFTVITEPWRLPLIGIAVAMFAVAVVVVGGLRGMRSLVALALTLTVVVKVVVPLLLRGVDPILLAVGVAAGVTLVTLLLTEGWSRVTLAAVLGTFAALALTAVLANAFTTAAEFTALQGNRGDRLPDPARRRPHRPQWDPPGGHDRRRARRHLDDVTVTQAATVEQLHRAEPTADRAGVIARAMRVGRSHVAATVNTLVLAYLGAGLPLLLLFALGGQSPLIVSTVRSSRWR